MTTTVPRSAPPPRARPAGGETLAGQNGSPAPLPRVSFNTIPDGAGHRIVLYGPGGIGKTTSAATAPGPVAIFDLDDSLPRLRSQLAESGLKLDLRCVETGPSWQNIRQALHAPGWDDVKTIVIDSATRAEELAIAHTLATIPHEKRETPRETRGRDPPDRRLWLR